MYNCSYNNILRKCTCLAVAALCVVTLTVAVGDEQETPEALFRRAAEHERSGRMAQAADAFALFLEKYPAHGQRHEVHYRLAKALDGVGRVDEAIEHLEAALDGRATRFRNRQEASLLLGKLLGEIKEYQRAVTVLERLLAEGAGIYEDEVLNMCAGYYAVMEQYEEAAAKFNILKRRRNSAFAERASYRLALVWLQAGDLELAVAAASDFATDYPANQEARGLMLSIADTFREQRKWDQALSICEQLRTRFPDAPEARAALYIVASCFRDRREFERAAQAFEAIARVPENIRSGLAAEAMLKAADVYYSDINNVEKAMERYDEAARLAREYTDRQRQAEILEVCYFRLAEHYFAQQKWSVALEYYSLLREIGTSVNILPRIMRCQAELGLSQDPREQSGREVEFLRKTIAANPGTFAAAEGETFLADRELERRIQRRHEPEQLLKVLELYDDVLQRYPRSVLSTHPLEAYIHIQRGRIYAAVFQANLDAGIESQAWNDAVKAFQAALDTDGDMPFKLEALEYIAQTADAAGQSRLAFQTYSRLYELTDRQQRDGHDDGESAERMAGYLRSMLTRADAADAVEDALRLARGIVEQQGADTAAGRHALFYIGELYYIRRDFSAAARAFREFISTYGPEQDADGNLARRPWQPRNVDEIVAQVYEAAVRVAHCWHLQGHTQNMLKAYQWIVDNIPHNNRYMAEAQYWLAMELGKGENAEGRAERAAFARRLWTTVVSPVFIDDPAWDDDGGPQIEARNVQRNSPWYFWINDRDMRKYVQPAVIKSGEIMSGLNEHTAAARAFSRYLRMFPEPRVQRGQPAPEPDEYRSIARYALGLELIELRDVDRLAEVYRPYLGELREDRFRVAALRLLGFHLSRGDDAFIGAEAYATLLDEYGENRLDAEGQPLPVPADQRIRRNSYGWNGIRMPLPDGLDLSQVRYALGFLYWQNRDWQACIRTLQAFVDDPRLANSEHRAQALYMTGQSFYRMQNYRDGVKTMLQLISAYPGFEAIEEVYVRAAWGLVEEKQWEPVRGLHQRFVRSFPQALNRPHMDLYLAVSEIEGGQREAGLSRLRDLAGSSTYEDVKADAHYYLGIALMPGWHKVTVEDLRNPEAAELDPDALDRYNRALRLLDKSVEYYPRARACLAAAKCNIALKNWSEARVLLDRVIRDFPDADRLTANEAAALLPHVLVKTAARQ